MAPISIRLAETGLISAISEAHANELEQMRRMRRLFATVVMAVIDDAIEDNKRFRDGTAEITSWARSRNGQEVLTLAGIVPCERTVAGLVQYVEKGKRTAFGITEQTHEAVVPKQRWKLRRRRTRSKP